MQSLGSSSKARYLFVGLAYFDCPIESAGAVSITSLTYRSWPAGCRTTGQSGHVDSKRMAFGMSHWVSILHGTEVL